jgi:hypothetical protein
MLPFIYTALMDSLSDNSILKKSDLIPTLSADLFSFVVPPSGNPLYAEFVLHIYALFETNFTEWDSYLGISTMALMLLGVFKLEMRKTGMWVLMFFLFMIIGLGPHPQIMGKQFDDIQLPFYFLQELPVIEAMTSPKRFLVTAMLAAAVLAGFGAHYLLSRKVTSHWPSLVLMMVLVGLIITDYWGWPRNLFTSNASYPVFLENIAREEDDIVTLSIPITDIWNTQPLYYQTIHGKKMIGGYVERPLPEVVEHIEENKFLSGISMLEWVAHDTLHNLPAQRAFEGKKEITPEEERDAFKLFFQYPELKYVIYMKRLYFHPDMRLFAVYRPWLERHFGAPVYEDDLVAVYRVIAPSSE